MTVRARRRFILALSGMSAFLATCVGVPQVDGRPAFYDVAEGRRLFVAVCAGCHGIDGRARVGVSEVYFPPPRDLSQGVYRFRSTASGTLPLREDLLRTLSEGLPGTAMPGWRDQMSRRQLMSLVVYLETLSPRFQDEDSKPEDDDIIVRPGTLRPPPQTADRVARGREIYQRMQCGKCHGDRGRGDGPSVETLRNEDGSRSQVFDFTTGLYRGGRRPEDLYRTFMTGLDGTPMPSYADSIPDEDERWALVYYCLSLSRERGIWFYLTERPGWYDPALVD